MLVSYMYLGLRLTELRVCSGLLAALAGGLSGMTVTMTLLPQLLLIPLTRLDVSLRVAGFLGAC